MADKKDDLPGRGAGWVVAAIVAVVAVCAVSFMITQRPQDALAVAAGDPPLAAAPTAPTLARPNGPRMTPTMPAAPPAGADTGRNAPPFPTASRALSADEVGSNASATEPAH